MSFKEVKKMMAAMAMSKQEIGPFFLFLDSQELRQSVTENLT
jgi:hypothetical protein